MINEFIDKLPDNEERIEIDYKYFKQIPNLMRFTNLVMLNCCNNLLTSLPKLPPTLKTLYCPYNYLEELPELPHTLRSLFCYKNRLKFLPRLPTTLKKLYCSHNQLTLLPELPLSITELRYNNNPLIYREDSLHFICIANQVIENCKYLFYCLKFKRQFRDWLWERVRRPKIEAQFHPSRIAELLENGVDLENLDAELNRKFTL